MDFIIRCRFRPGGAQERFAIRVPHIEYMIAALPFTVIGGPRFTEDTSGEAVGLMIVIDVPDLEAAHRFVESEPYHKAGLFEATEIEAFRVMTAEILERELTKERARLSGSQ